jgi:hypothetical protein
LVCWARLQAHERPQQELVLVAVHDLRRLSNAPVDAGTDRYAVFPKLFEIIRFVPGSEGQKNRRLAAAGLMVAIAERLLACQVGCGADPANTAVTRESC